MTTLFQDSAGTTPVTAVEQVVGKILDKSGNGNRASQSTTASKPKLSARKNKLLATTTLATQSVTLTASPHTLSFKGTGTVTLTGASTAGPLVGTGVGNRVSLTFTPTAGSVTFTVSGSVTEAQLEDGSAASTYQRVTTATDYDTAGFPHYLKFDGVDDFLSTGNIDFTSTDKMTVVAGVTKLSDAAAGTLVELSADPSANNGSFGIRAPQSGHANFGATVKGTATVFATAAPKSFAAPYAGVLSQAFNLSGASADQILAAMRVNGTAVAPWSPSGTAGGTFGNYPLYIGRRGGFTSPFNGHLCQLTVRGAATADLTPGETFTADKTGVTLP